MTPLAAGCEAYYLYLNGEDSLLEEGQGLSGGCVKGEATATPGS